MSTIMQETAAQPHKRTSAGTIVPPEFGPLLRAARLASGISLRALSPEAGIDRGQLGRFERGQVPVSLNFYSHAVVTLANMIGVKAATA
jgi:hypothetical protein